MIRGKILPQAGQTAFRHRTGWRPLPGSPGRRFLRGSAGRRFLRGSAGRRLSPGSAGRRLAPSMARASTRGLRSNGSIPPCHRSPGPPPSAARAGRVRAPRRTRPGAGDAGAPFARGNRQRAPVPPPLAAGRARPPRAGGRRTPG